MAEQRPFMSFDWGANRILFNTLPGEDEDVWFCVACARIKSKEQVELLTHRPTGLRRLVVPDYARAAASQRRDRFGYLYRPV